VPGKETAMSKPQPEIDGLFHALGDPTRRAILDLLSRGPISVTRLAGPLGVTLTAVGQHLQILEESDLVRTEKVGRVRTCRIEQAGFTQLEKWIKEHRSHWELSLDRLGEFLTEEDENTNR
jgi:DNA-binding transcriptional ArsR family regulator